MKAVVMAGGFGTRIQPLTNSLPKPMLPVLNKPMMQYMIEKLKDIGITEFVVLLYFKPEVIMDYFGDGERLGVKIHYVIPDDDYGTAGAVKKAEEFLDETFFIVSGDLITDFDFKKIADYHKEKRSKLTITLTPVEDPLQFGVVISSPEGKIEKFLEKPSWGEVFSDTINTGIYILEPEILQHIPKDENYDFGKQLFPGLMKEGIDLWGCSMEGYWRDVGNPESYRSAHRDLLQGKVDLFSEGVKKEYEKGILYAPKGLKIPKDLTVEGTVILAENVKIGTKVKLKDVVIGPDTTIDKESEVSECTIWHDVEIGEKSLLRNCVICNKNRIEKKVKAQEGVIMAENCEVGKLTSIEKDVIIWPDKIIEEASVVSNNIIWGNKYKSSIFEGGKVVGRTNIELSCDMATKLAESFGSMLPVGSKVYVSRDYHKGSRMIKRAFLGGLLSTGINVNDVKHAPSNVMRNVLAQDEDIVAGVHIRQSVENLQNTEIIFFTSEGLEIDTNTQKSCERIFFRESFRRVNIDDIGEIVEGDFELKQRYRKNFLENIDMQAIREGEPKIVVDMLFGSTTEVYPEIINSAEIENIMLNAYVDDKKLSRISSFISSTEKNVSSIVNSLKMDMGFSIFPNGQRIHMVCDKGNLLQDYEMLLMVLDLLNRDAKRDEKSYKVYLPVYSPDIMDSKFKNLEIERGKFGGFVASKLKQYDLVANVSGNYAFTAFALNNDALFTSVKIIELLAKHNLKPNDILKKIPSFYYVTEKVDCPASLKGKMMRMFMEDSKGKEASHVDGVKIWINEKSWVLMIPHQNADLVTLYIQADKEATGKKIIKEYSEKIKNWQNEA